MSEKAPLQDRFSERIRARGTRVQLGDWGVVLVEKGGALVGRICDRQVNAEVVSSLRLRKRQRGREGLAATIIATVAAFLLASRCLVSRAMLVRDRLNWGVGHEARNHAMVGRHQPGRDDQEGDRRAAAADDWRMLHG